VPDGIPTLDYPATLFREVQTARGKAYLVFAGGLFGLCLAISVYAAIVDGETTLALIVLGVGTAVAALLLSVRMVVVVTRERLTIRYFPLPFRETIPISRIGSYEVVAYRPLADFGGWGIRYSGRLRALGYTVSGTQAVRIVRPGLQTLMVGTQRPEELSEALRRAGAVGGAG
jgi:hypothetical protein